MELPKMNRQGGGMFDGIKNKLGFNGDDAGSDDYYEDYDDYAEDYEDYDGSEGGEEYSPYPEVTTRNAGTNRSRRSSYSDRAANDLGERRMASTHPHLVSKDDVRASTSQSSTSSYVPATTRRRSSGLGRDTVGRASDFAISGSEMEDYTPPSADDAKQSDPGATADLGSSRSSGYDSLFNSSKSRSASDIPEKPAAAVGVGVHDSRAASSAYDPYAAYEGAGSPTHKPTRALVVLTPISYGEVENIARNLKAGDAVVLSLRNTPNQLAKRILDFSFGVASALDASVDCIADKVFAITRSSALNDAECMKLRSQGVI